MTSPLEQKKIKITGPSMVTANRTWDGAVVYRTAKQGWSTELADSAIVTTSDEAVADVRLIDAIQQADLTVGAYLADVDTSTDTPKPSHFREAFRAKGPSNYAHGKQEVQ